MKFKLYHLLFKKQERERGFFALALVLVILLSFLPILNYLSDSLDNSHSLNLIYKSKQDIENINNTVFDHLHNYNNCKASFNIVNPETQGAGQGIQTSVIRNFDDQKITTSNTHVNLDRVNLCFYGKKNNPSIGENPCSTSKPATLINVSGTHINTNASLVLKFKSELLNNYSFKYKKIFVEFDTSNRLIKCSTAEPALNSQQCEPVNLQKTCCRYSYKYELGEGVINYIQEDILNPKEHNPEIINSASGQRPDQDCATTKNKLQIKAKCLRSSWDYQLTCIK